jgi:hypothetical protein
MAMQTKFRDLVNGATSDIHTSAKHILGFEAVDIEGGVWKYMKGITSCAQGSHVTFDEAGVTALLAANAKGPVAVAGAAIDANTKYGWFQVISGPSSQARIVTATSDNTLGGREGADGDVGDGRAAGDEIYSYFIRGANASGSTALTAVQFYRPFVDDAKGA